MLCYLGSEYIDEDSIVDGVSNELDNTVYPENATISEEHRKYAWFLANEARRAFAGLSMHFPGHSFIGYVSVYTKISGTLDQFIIEMSRGGKEKVRFGPRRPSIRSYNYLSDGRRLQADIILGLTEEPGAISTETVAMFEILLEQRIIKSVMEFLEMRPLSRAALAHKARIETACEVLSYLPAKEIKAPSQYYLYIESYGFNAYRDKDWNDALLLFESERGWRTSEDTEQISKEGDLFV